MQVDGASSYYITGYQNDDGQESAGTSSTGSGDWVYNVGIDTDGDGSVDNQQTMSEQELNAMIASTGVQFVGGVATSVDGFNITAGNNSVVNDIGGDPRVGNPAGERVSNEELRQKLDGLGEFSTEGSLAWMALSEMARTAEKERKTARELRDALQTGKFEEKQNSLNAQAAKVEAERGAAWVQFAGACVAGAMNVAGAGAFGQVGNNAGQAIIQSSSLATTLFSSMDKAWGYAAEADKQELRSKARDLEAEKLDMYIDSASSNLQEAKESRDKAIKLLEEISQRQTDRDNTITRG